MLDCQFSFEAYAKNEVLLDADGHALTTFDIYQGTVAPNYFKSHTNSQCPDLFSKNSFV